MSGAPKAEVERELRRFKPYAAYKDSGVEWLGEIPEHWEVKRLKEVVIGVEQGWSPLCENRQADDHEWGVLKVGCVNGEHFDEAEHKALPADLDPLPEYEVRSGDILMSRANTRKLLGSAAFVRRVRPRLLLCDKLYRIRVRGEQVLPEFLVRACASALARFQLEREATGASGSMQNISQEMISNLLLPLPSTREQCVTTAFLDRETAKIDALVAKKERLIELLQEERTALITRTITKGLDPNVPMKDSGVEWLGEIPEHWNVMPLGQAMQLVMDFRGRTPLKLGMDWGGDIPAISAGNVRDGHLDLSLGINYGSSQLHDRWMTQGPTQAGDIVFTTEAPLGNVAMLADDRQYILSQRVVLLRPRPEQVDATYLFHFLRSSAFCQGVESRATGSTAEGVKRRYLMSMPICVPPLEEQRSLSRRLGHQVSALEQVLPAMQQAVRFLQELRTALISAAVTGKIDVRQEVA